jgi:EpsI family protein
MSAATSPRDEGRGTAQDTVAASRRARTAGLGWLQAAIAVVVMGVAALSASLLTPSDRLAEYSRDIVLEEAVPKSFRGWRLDPNQGAEVVNPQQQSLLQALYSQTLARTYVDEQGRRVMLSIAYGGMQGGSLELHRPEVCYVAQGFALERLGASTLGSPVAGRSIPLQRLMSRQRGREEPISYWMRVGDDLMVSGLSQQISRIRQGLQGKVPDGILFRVSSISADSTSAYALQDRFVQDLLASSPPRLQRFLIGPVSANRSGPRHD